MVTKQKHWQLFSFSFWLSTRRILLPSFSFFLSLSLCFVSYLSFHLSFFLLSLGPVHLSIFACLFVSHLSFFFIFFLSFFHSFFFLLSPIFLSIFFCFSFSSFFLLSLFILPPLSPSAPLSTHPDSSFLPLLHSFAPSLSLSSLWEVKLRNLSECSVSKRVRTVFFSAVLQPTAAPSQSVNQWVSGVSRSDLLLAYWPLEPGIKRSRRSIPWLLTPSRRFLFGSIYLT